MICLLWKNLLKYCWGNILRDINSMSLAKTLSPQEVRNILQTDNKEIVELCRQASIMPKKNSKGQTYFSYDEVKHLRELKKNLPASAVTSPVTATSATSAVASILTSIRNMESTLSDKISKVIDEKLEGMDEVVVELIRCKTDNETLKQKIIDLNKEIYQLKNDLSSYKHVGLGLYKKKEKHVWE